MVAFCRPVSAVRQTPLLWLLLSFGVRHHKAGCYAAKLTQEEVEATGKQCAAKGAGGASGPEFVACLGRGVGSQPEDDHFLELVRNFSCAQDDAGTLPLRTVSVSVGVGYDACEAAAAAAAPPPSGDGVEEVHPDLMYLPGVLPAGNDLGRERQMSAEQAAEHCLADDSCEGFTFSGRSPRGPSKVFFKSTAEGFSPNPSWHTYKRLRPLTCPAAGAARVEEKETRSFTVDIVREEPLIAVIRKFASREECDRLVNAGGNWEDMSRAYTSQGGFSSARRSYSANIYPPLKDPDDPITKLTAQMFAVTRNLTGYQVFPPGQEPVNAVLYKHQGDEYRPHCDGSCSGSMHRVGERIATSIVYCRAAEKGGQTSFTEGALKVQPGDGDMLLFAYRYSGGRMTGNEAQHSGCPIRQGKKWIATQWYREGVSEVWNWESANQGTTARR